jgi:predicted DNA-binding transcriptional regulator YafY
VPAGWGTVEPIDDRTCEYRSGDDNLEWLAIRVAMLGVEFEVHEPPELAEQLGALADRLARAATGSPRSSRPGAA